MARLLKRLAVFFAASFALVGVMHMPFARNLLRSAGGCPFPSTDRVMTPAEAEQLRVATLAPSKALSEAPARPALGFTLEQTQRSDITRWAKAHGIDCKADRHSSGLTCANVAATQLPAPTSSRVRGSLMFGFTPEGSLVSVHYLSRDTSRTNAISRAAEATELLASLAAPLAQQGTLGLERPLSQGRRSVAFRNYAAEIAATNVGPAYTVSESYQSFRP